MNELSKGGRIIEQQGRDDMIGARWNKDQSLVMAICLITTAVSANPFTSSLMGRVMVSNLPSQAKWAQFFSDKKHPNSAEP